ncbi:MAG TPA: hypothetical protein VFV38_04660 [Ktedonobacteraceae bacterium]|nr:hypothetical protein [Ktedonobacteraceae bacterium]
MDEHAGGVQQADYLSEIAIQLDDGLRHCPLYEIPSSDHWGLPT